MYVMYLCREIVYSTGITKCICVNEVVYTSTLMHAGNGDITKKLKCASGVLAIAGVVTAVLLLALIALMVVFIEVYPSYTSSYFAFTDKDGMTVLLGTVNTPWYSSVTVEQHEDHFHTTIYVVPSSEVKVHECTSSKRCPSGPINTNKRIAGRVDDIYLLESASFDYTMCLNNYSSNATAVAFIFDNETARNNFMDGESDGYQSSVYHQNLPIASGTSVYKCSTVVFTSPHDAFYSVTTEVTFDNSGSTGHQIGSMCNITTHIKYFNHSEYRESCTTLNPSETCDVNILELQKSWFGYNTYTMLAFVQEEQFEEHPANLTVQVNKSWYNLVLPGGSVLLCIVLFAIIMFALGVVLYRRRKVTVSAN